MKVVQERDELPGNRLTAIGVSVLIVSAMFSLVAWGVLRCNATPQPPDRDQIPPDEVNQIELTLFRDLPDYGADRRIRQAWLETYGWVERERGIIHIPIERAIELYLERNSEERR